LGKRSAAAAFGRSTGPPGGRSGGKKAAKTSPMSLGSDCRAMTLVWPAVALGMFMTESYAGFACWPAAGVVPADRPKARMAAVRCS